MRHQLCVALVLTAGSRLEAQSAKPIPASAVQIAQAVLPLPDSMRAGARIWGWSPDGRFVELRPGTGTMTCIADDPRDARFQVACYHNSMEAYMARGRELRAAHTPEPAVDSIRFADVAAGRIHLPAAASLYSLNGADTVYVAPTNTVRGATPLFVLYMPFATEATTGVSATPARGKPWLMHPGTPTAHIMLVGEMR